MSLKLMYITNRVDVALIAEKHGVDRVWVDLETLGKEERQKNMNTVKSRHEIDDVKKLGEVLTRSELLVRINPWNPNSIEEINKVIDAGADVIMLPMWKTAQEVESFVKAVDKRAITVALLETKEGVDAIDEVLGIDGIDEIHIGLNDLHLSYGLTFMFELLSDGTVDKLCAKIAKKGIPYGFGGIARIGEGLLPAENIITDHYRLGSTRAILSRSFCNTEELSSIEEIENVFESSLRDLRKHEKVADKMSKEEFLNNHQNIKDAVATIVAYLNERKNNG